MFKLSRVIFIGVFIITGCSSTNKANLSSEDPSDAIREVQRIKINSFKNQVDLLAYEKFENGENNLNKAILELKNNDDRNDVLEKLSQSKAYFLEAISTADSRSVVPERILSARKAALNSQLRESHSLVQELKKIDEDLREETHNFSRVLSVEKLSQFERKYLKLEINSVQNTKLLVFRNIIEDAERKNAKELAPKTYRNAVVDLNAAENMIQQSPRNPDNFKKSIITVDKSTKLLSDVIQKLTGVASGASEEAALQLVYQERKLGVLSNRTTRLESSLRRSKSDLGNVTDELQSKTDEAFISGNKVRLQKAINDMRKNFSKDEAEVYQQGNDLIIRLKKIDFKSGSAMIPSDSMNLLSRVNSAIIKLNSSKIIVQGHTDSTGKRGNNNILSMKRSKSVAKYLESLDGYYKISSRGYGESQPIGNNQTKEGRAMNRRVDIIVNAKN